MGASNDLQLYHDSTFNNSVIDNVNGHLVIRNNPSNTTKDVYIQSDNDVLITSIAAGETFAKFSDDAGVELYFDNVKKFETTSTGATVTGIFNIGDGSVSDNYIGLGAANDLKIFHNGSHSIIRETGTGSLYVQSDNNVILGSDSGTETYVKGIYNGAVELYHNNVKKLETTATGVTVSSDLLLGSSTAVSSVLDEDNFASDSATALATQQSIKAYVDGRFTQTTTTVNTLATDGLTITDNNVSANRTNDDLILSASGTGNVVVNSDMKFNDNDKLFFGNDDDLEIFHNASNGNTIIQENTGGNLVIKGSNLFLQSAGSETFFKGVANGAVELYHDNTKRFETTSSGISVTDHIALADSGELRLGTDNDMQILHSGASGFVKNTTGTLILQGSTVRIQDAGSSQTAISAADGVATLYHTNTAVLNTTAGGIQIEKGVQEKFATVTGASGVTALDCSNGHIFYKTGCTGDITANFTNLTLTAEYAVNLMVIINQGATPYEVTAVQIGGSAQTLNWQGGSQPTGNANGIDAFSFTILNDGGSYVVLGQMVDFT